MTYDYVMKATIRAVEQGTKAHCFSAWIQGKGYVNRGELSSEMPEYTRQLLQTAQSEIDNMRWTAGYAGYSQENQPKRGVLRANWNNLPSKTTDILERMGYAIEWSDCYTECDGCQMAVETEPSHVWWKPQYSIVNGSEVLCIDCLQDEAGESSDYDDE